MASRERLTPIDPSGIFYRLDMGGTWSSESEVVRIIEEATGLAKANGIDPENLLYHGLSQRNLSRVQKNGIDADVDPNDPRRRILVFGSKESEWLGALDTSDLDAANPFRYMDQDTQCIAILDGSYLADATPQGHIWGYYLYPEDVQQAVVAVFELVY